MLVSLVEWIALYWANMSVALKWNAETVGFCREPWR